MSDRSSDPILFGSDGELVLLRVTSDPKSLEELLDALAGLDFPVNPELFHKPGRVTVEFPAYAGQISAVRAALEACDFDDSLEIGRVLPIALSA